MKKLMMGVTDSCQELHVDCAMIRNGAACGNPIPKNPIIETTMAAMTPDDVLVNFEQMAQLWIDALNAYDEEQFSRRPPEGWSVGQLYYHIVQSANYFQLAMLEQCAGGEAAETDEEMNERGKPIFEQGAFPPIQIKGNSPLHDAMPQPASIDQARADLMSLIIRMRMTAPLVAQANPRRKTPHPGLGMLNAQEWYHLVLMHFRHHLHQKSRINAWLGMKDTAGSVAG